MQSHGEMAKTCIEMGTGIRSDVDGIPVTRNYQAMIVSPDVTVASAI